jgi:hypothetical protein
MAAREAEMTEIRRGTECGELRPAAGHDVAGIRRVGIGISGHPEQGPRGNGADEIVDIEPSPPAPSGIARYAGMASPSGDP